MGNTTLNRSEFGILVAINETKSHISQRAMAARIHCSPATVNRLLKHLEEKGLYDGKEITEKGILALQPYRVKRAVFLAAGFGSRLMPVTLNTPKPLVRVGGVRLIDTLLDAVLAAGITEIYVVRGHFGEQFDQLLYKYPMIRFVDNPDFNETNNISSAMCVRNLLGNAYVFEADLFLRNKELITGYQYACNYIGYYTERTDDWCTDIANGKISGMKMGGEHCFRILGISYWDEEAGSKLAEDIRRVYEMPGGKEKLWDYVPLEFFRNHYQVELRACSPEDLSEVDTFRELKALDASYAMG